MIKLGLRYNSGYCPRIISTLGMIGLCLAFSQSAQAQNGKFDNLSTNKFVTTGDTILFSDKTIIQSSFTLLKSRYYNPSDFKVSDNSISLQYNGNIDTIELQYRTLALDLYENKAAIDSSFISTDERVIITKARKNLKQENARRLIQSSRLEYTGSFSRGVSFGNTQDVVLNSNFNLQMRGDLGNNLYVRAAISDENLPIQPEGNTQVLQEFDKVFIELEKDRTKVIAGDYELSRPKGYFMNYYKKLKGLAVNNSNKINENLTINTRGSFAVSRGKFRRQFLVVQDGNQGPYRLEGENGEVFLQVLSGTEKVFADGRLLKRGEDNDYTIDYNRAEIRFTPQLIITANLRIIVEFEYAVQSYLRSLYTAGVDMNSDKLQFSFNFYNEQDSKNLTGNIELDSIDRSVLVGGGDNQNFRNGIFIPDAIDENLTLYRNNNGILEFTSVDTTNVVGAVFSNFGEGNGDYIIDGEVGTNGRVYKYVGSQQGSFLPLIRLVPPEQKQLMTMGLNYNLTDSTNIYIEGGLSNNDLNRFSTIDDENNSGFSFFSKVNDTRIINKKQKILLKTEASMELAEADFQALNPYRAAEFTRDWNLSSSRATGQQRLIDSKIELAKDKSYLNYGYGSFSDRGTYEGQRHKAQLNVAHKGLFFNALGDWLNSESPTENAQFFRPRIRAKQDLFDTNWSLGFYFEKEKNERFSTVSDSLINGSFNYDLSRLYIENKANDNLTFRVAYAQRIDDRAFNNTLEQTTISDNIEWGGTWITKNNSSLEWQLVYRDYRVNDNFLDQDNPNKSFIGNINHNLNLFNKGIQVSSYYEANSGQEPRIEFQFVKVQVGEGSYVWNDYNQDSIQQINEFEISPFSDLAAYEKISVFNNEFVSTNRNIINQSIKIDPKILAKNKDGFLSKLFFNSRYRIDQKILNEGDGSLINFINFDLTRSGLVSYNASMDHNVFFNRGNPSYDIQLAYRLINNRIQQITGFEQRSNRSIYSRVRYNLQRKFDLLLETNFGEKNRDSENFANQRFQIDFYNINPQLNFRPNPKWRLVTEYTYEINENRLGETESATLHDFGTELTWRQNQKSNLQFKFNAVIIDFNGESNSPVEFEMLQGLRNGNNFLINLNYTRRISNSVDMIINYNGRKSEGAQLVNIASVQMRAIF